MNQSEAVSALIQQIVYPGLVPLALWILSIILAMFLAVYIYTSLAYSSIAKKNKRTDGALAWIPFVGKPLLESQIAKMHWWPVLLLIGFIIPYIGFIAMILFTVYWFIWNWKVFQSVGKPGGWILLILIPFAGLLVYLILLGIAAWSEQEAPKVIKTQKIVKKK